MNSNRDTALLDLLGEEGAENGLRWCCRNSTRGHGIRLYQVAPDALNADETVALTGEPSFATPREALEAYLDGID